MRYIITIAMILLLTACTTQITATPKDIGPSEEKTLEEIPEERIPLSPTSTGERVNQRQLEDCEKIEGLKAEVLDLRAREETLTEKARDQKFDLDRLNVELQQLRNKLQNSLLTGEQIAQMSAKLEIMQEELDDQFDKLRNTNKQLKSISEELVEKEREAEFIRFRCLDVQS